MATISTVAVDFVANTAKYTQGLTGMQKQTKAWSAGIKKDTQAATDAFDGVSKALNKFATQAVSIVAIQKIGAAFIQVAKDVSILADEAEKVGASAAQFSKLDLAAQRNGSTLNDVKTGYKELQKSINEGLSGTETATRAFLELGVSWTSLSKQKPDEQFLIIADALSKVEDANKRAELGNVLLGKSYTELAPLIAKGRAGIEAAGRGAISGIDVASIDRVTKSFEEIGRVLDLQIKKALIELSPIILSIANSIRYATENITAFAALIGVAFIPTALTKFAAAATLLAEIISFQLVKSLLAASAAANVASASFLGLSRVSLFSTLSAATPALLSITTALTSFAAAAALALKTISIFALAFEAVTRIVEKSASLLGFDQYAEALKQLRESVEDFVLGFFGFETAADKIKKFEEETGKKLEAARKRLEKLEEQALATQEQLARDVEFSKFNENLSGVLKNPDVSAKLNGLIDLFSKWNNEIQKSPPILKAMQNALNDVYSELTKQGEAITKDVMTPYENANAEFNKLTLAFDLGTITIDTYIRAIEKLKNSIDDVDLAKLRAVYGTGPMGALGKFDKTAITDQTRFMQRGIAAENFGAGTVVTGKLPAGLDNITSKYAELQQQLKSTGTSLLENGRTAIEVYDSEVQAINAAVEAYKLQGREQDALRLQTIALLESSNKLRDANIEAFARANPYIIQAFGYMSDFADQFSRAIVAGESFGEALSGVFKNILKDITAMILRTTILQGIMAAIGIISPTTNAAAAFGQMTGLTGRANGGPVMAGDGYRVGERGPETFVPAANGYILPNDMAPSETVVVNQTINVQTGVAQTVRAEMASLLPRFKSEAMAGVLDAKQRGGGYARGLAA